MTLQRVAGESSSWLRFCPLTSNPHPEQLSQAGWILRGAASETPAQELQTPSRQHKCRVSFGFGLIAGWPLLAPQVNLLRRTQPVLIEAKGYLRFGVKANKNQEKNP